MSRLPLSSDGRFDRLDSDLRFPMEYDPLVATYMNRVKADGGIFPTGDGPYWLNRRVQLLKDLGLINNGVLLTSPMYGYHTGSATNISKMYNFFSSSVASSKHGDLVQNSDSARPVYTASAQNGKSAAQFVQGSSQVLDDATFDTTLTAKSLFVVGAITVAEASLNTYCPFIILGNAANNAGGRICAKLSTNVWGTYVGSDVSGGGALTTNVFYLLESVDFGTVHTNNTILYKNIVNSANSSNLMQTGTAGHMSIGNESGQTRFLSGQVCEVLVLNVGVSNSQRIAIENDFEECYRVY